MSTMIKKATTIAIAGFLAISCKTAVAADLVMVKEPGCIYCIEWKKTIGPIYPNTEAGMFAPLTVIDKSEPAPFANGYATPIIYTPTFILVENNTEIGRILGYPGEDFFWAILEKMLENETDFYLPS